MSSAKKTISARERLGRNLRSYREKLGWSQENLAAQAGLTQTFLSQVENGLSNVSLDNIERLAEALELDVVDLLKI